MEQKLAKQREALGLTQQDVAVAIGCSIRTVGNWEQGTTQPRSHHLSELLRLGFNVTELLEGETE